MNNIILLPIKIVEPPEPDGKVISHNINLVMNKNVSKINLTGGRSSNKEDSLLKFKLSISNSQKDFFIGKRTIMPRIFKEFISKYDNLNPGSSSNKFIPWS